MLASGAYYTEDERVYFDEETEGFVLVHREHATHSFASELVVARSYAALGHQVVLQKEVGAAGRVADADIDGEPWEFKEITAESANVRNRLQDGMRSARKQGARCVAFHINRAEFNEGEARKGIKNGFFWDRSEELILVDLIFDDGTRRRYQRTDFEEEL